MYRNNIYKVLVTMAVKGGTEENEKFYSNRFFKYVLVPLFIPLMLIISIMAAMFMSNYENKTHFELLISVTLILLLVMTVPFFYYYELYEYKKILKRKIYKKYIRSIFTDGLLFLMLWFIITPFLIILYIFRPEANPIMVLIGFLFVSILTFELGYLKLNTAKKLRKVKKL